jgi:hypothetical protein
VKRGSGYPLMKTARSASAAARVSQASSLIRQAAFQAATDSLETGPTDRPGWLTYAACQRARLHGEPDSEKIEHPT